MKRKGRLQVDETTHLPTINTFGDLSQYLHGAVADDSLRHFSQGMRDLAAHVEAVVASLRGSRERAVIAPQLVDLLTVLRVHRNLVADLGLPWRGLYEFATYLQSLNNFRVRVGQWLLDGGPLSEQLAVTADEFEQAAWRMLGDGMLLIDVYEQWVASQPQQL